MGYCKPIVGKILIFFDNLMYLLCRKLIFFNVRLAVNINIYAIKHVFYAAKIYCP